MSATMFHAPCTAPKLPAPFGRKGISRQAAQILVHPRGYPGFYYSEVAST